MSCGRLPSSSTFSAQLDVEGTAIVSLEASALARSVQMQAVTKKTITQPDFQVAASLDRGSLGHSLIAHFTDTDFHSVVQVFLPHSQTQLRASVPRPGLSPRSLRGHTATRIQSVL